MKITLNPEEKRILINCVRARKLLIISGIENFNTIENNPTNELRVRKQGLAKIETIERKIEEAV